MANLNGFSTICPSRGDLTSSRYNRGQLYKAQDSAPINYIFSVDWFEANCLHGLNKGLLKDFDIDDVQEVYEGFHTCIRKDIKTGAGTKIYKYGFDVSFNGQSIGLLLMCPRQSFRDEYSCSFKVYNHILYQKSWPLIVDSVLDDIGLRINNFTRIDIACDGSGFLNKYKLLNEGIYQNVGRAGHCNYQTGKNVITGFDIGSKKSDKSCTGYRKGKTLLSSNKKYISDYWEANGLTTPTASVERLELKLKNKAIKSIVSFDYQRLSDQVYLASIMKSQLNGFFQLVKNSSLKKDSNITRAKKLDLIPWSKLELINVIKMKKIKKPSTIWAAKRYITFGLQRIHAECELNENLFDNPEMKKLHAIAEEYQIVSWFNSLKKRIAERDKAQISEIKYNRKEFIASGKTLYSTNH